ncbi:hypothetical protein BV898_05704 [Hypsibius exemplaris]|uniref:Uncharacterized protein n=1 Tax=Hypsibius exemplaris TaxID=2072580 RepID=A0A1W0WYY5_HYPEX|nr:hypothetical protein BV898_05704 [Hypsibius exemplaris]
MHRISRLASYDRPLTIVHPSVGPSVSPSVSQFDDELLNKVAGISEIFQVNASLRSPWALTLVNFEITPRTAHVWLYNTLASGQLFSQCALSRCRLLLPMTFPFGTVTVRNFSGTLTSWEEPVLAEYFRRCLGRPDGLAPDILADVRRRTGLLKDQAEQLRVRTCLKNWDDWNRCGGFAEDISGIEAVIWQDIEVLTLVEIFVRKVLRDVRYNRKTHAMHVAMECADGTPNVSLINIIMIVYTKEDGVHERFVRSLKVLL